MTKTLPRDRWLAAALPALLTLLIGWLIFLNPETDKIEKLRTYVENRGSLEDRKAQVNKARAERAALEKNITKLHNALATQEGSFDHNLAMQQVSELCQANGLSLNKSVVEKDPKLPRTLSDAISTLSKPGHTPQVWRLEITGSYAGVLQLLEGLRKAAPLVIPLNLSMQADPPATWVFTVWL